MQCDLMDAYEVSRTGENLSPLGEGTQSTNKNGNRCRYGAVMPVMVGHAGNQQQACPA